MSLEKDEVKEEEEEEDNECTCVSSPSFVYLLAMSKTVVFFILMIGLTHAQLNFEGNPLTENTEYTAEESHYSQSTAKREESTPSPANVLTDHPQKLYMFSEKDGRSTSQKPKLERNEMKSSLENAEQRNVVTVRQLSGSTYSQGTGMNHAELALNTFLNSKTPEESRLSLEHYLQSRESPKSQVSQNHLHQAPPNQLAVSSQYQLAQPLVAQINQPTAFVETSPVNQQLTAQLMQQRQTLQAFPVVNPHQQLQPSNQMYDPSVNPSNLVNNPLGMQQQDVQQMPYVPRIQARNDMYYPVGWQNPVRRIRGKPYPLVQPRIGPGSFVPNPVPFKKKGPVELIYTRPPGFLHRPPRMEKHPPPYLEDSIGFAEGDHPPSHNEIRYSQLYAQSYDPYYYDYIAKTGKIKPHLYWKLGKHRESKDDSIWTELYRGFKKHGLQKMMTPGFFLGMTLPVVTLMLTALIQKRSLSRSDSREFSQEDTMQEYLERLQRAMECYEKKRTKGEANEDEC